MCGVKLIIQLKKKENCTKEELDLISYYDQESDSIVMIEDHDKVIHNLPFVLSHEVAHYYLERTKWRDSSFEELYNILVFQRSILQVGVLNYIGMFLRVCFI
jgi:Zn-dependent peptidase ImmA (M78 family)